MGMPEIPERRHKPDVCEVVVSLIESVAMEELAIAHIMNAEGEKLQETIKKFSCRDICFHKFEKMCGETNQLINSLIMQEWILLSKMNSALTIYETMSGDCNNPCSGKHGCTSDGICKNCGTSAT